MMRIIEEKLNEVLPPVAEQPQRLHEAMRYATFPGGKRLRPRLCVAAAQAAGGDGGAAVLPAVAIELLHTYTLIHDDLPALDNDAERRGKPTVHVQFDEATAILAGDALLTLAFEVMAATDNAELVRELAAATGSRGTIGGQQEDITITPKTVTKRVLDYVYLNKTAKLFLAATRIGGLVGQANDQTLQILSNFGLHLGLAYQFLDDFADQDQNTLAIYTNGEIVSQAKRNFSQALAALDALPGDSGALQEIAKQVFAEIPQAAV